MLAVKSFNAEHRSIAKVVTVIALVLIVLLSALFSCAIFVCSLFEKTTSVGKRIAGIALAVLLLCIAVFAANRFSGTGAANREVVETVIEPQNEQATTDQYVKETEAAVLDATSSEAIIQDKSEVAEPNISETTAINEANSSSEAIEPPATEPEVADSTPSASWNTSDIDLEQLMEAYPEMVGWVYFEDGHISYPIMHTEDNEKYRSLDYMGEEAPTGAIFLDYRSAADFSDANSIIYGHNMKDGTMFGSLREYRKDPAYYNDHMYFQVITPEKAYRYLIFEYMDVAENYVLYDYVSDAALEFVKDAEPVRIKSYMDSEIPVKEDSKVVTLSTCTRKDELQFVVLGVLVDEDEN